MKIKKLGALLVSAALCAGMAVPAFAFEGEAAPVEQPVLPEVVEEDVVTITDETSGALTPEGNLTLVDDYHANYSDGSGQQFITLVSKSGNTFYLVIDRNAKGQQTVHFMNLVDEADLLALMEEEDADAYTAEKEAVAQAEQDKLKAEEEAKKAAEEAAASGTEQPTENKVTKIASGFLGVVVLIALAAGGITVAVLGCGIDIAYPAANKNLFAQICERGALVTEYPPGTPPAAYNFPARNRIINGMTHGILVAEAAKKSGAMITAEYALEEGHEVYCVPGSIFLPTSIGCHSLIKSGAQLVDRPEDILESLKLASFPQQPALFGSDNGEDELDDNAKAVLKILSFEPLSLEEILEKSGLGLAEAGMGLLDLEMRGKVAQTAARSYYLL